jgi:hypothetical protein
MPTPSGKNWVDKFKGSNSLDTLKGSFASGARKFVAALHAAKAQVQITATFRPPQRAYLMHWAWEVAHGLDPSKVPAFSGVDIDWVHKDKAGKVDLAASKQAGQEMVQAFDMAHQAVLKTRHEEGLAVDMVVTWSGELKIKNAKGEDVTIKSSPQTNNNKDLQSVALTYGVHKLVSDYPHWSSDGH